MRNISNISDKEVLTLLQASKDNALIALLYDRYRHLVFGVGMKYLKNESRARDVVGDVYEKLLYANFSEIENFGAWVYVVAKNTCLMEIRSRESQERRERNFMLNQSEPNEHSVEDMQVRESLLKRAICLLSRPQAMCIELFYLEEKSYQEVSQLSGMDLNEVKSHIQNGKRNLKNILSRWMA